MFVWMRSTCLRQEIEQLKAAGWRVLGLINGYGRYLRQRKTNQAGEMHEDTLPYHSDENADWAADLPL
jgi:hypothetical protein